MNIDYLLTKDFGLMVTILLIGLSALCIFCKTKDTMVWPLYNKHIGYNFGTYSGGFIGCWR